MSYTSPIFSDVHSHEFVDVAFSSEAGSELLGWIPPTRGQKEMFRAYTPRYSGKIYPRKEWESRIRDIDQANGWRYRRIGHRFDQQEGSCVYNGLATVAQIIGDVQFGDSQMIPFSPMSGYKLNSRGPNSGSTVGGAIRHLESVGLLPSADYAPNVERMNRGEFGCVFGETGNYYESMPDGWKNTARLFRADEWEWCETIEEWVSAQMDGCVAEGGRARHAICHCGLAWDSGRIYSVYCNSWGAWGETLDTYNGPLQSFGLDSERAIQTMVASDGFVLRTMRTPKFLVE